MQREGFTAWPTDPRRLRMLLDRDGWQGPLPAFISTVQASVTASADGIRRTAETGDTAYQRMLDRGVDADLRIAVYELNDFC